MHALVAESIRQGEFGNLAEALRLGERAVEEAPDSAEAVAHLGRCLLGVRRLEEAKGQLERAIALDPDLAIAHYNLARTLQLLGQANEAAKEYAMAAHLQPSAQYCMAAASSLFSLSDYAKTAKLTEAILQTDPAHGPAHLLLAGALIELRRSTEAARHVHEVMALPADPSLAYDLGVRQIALGMMAEALGNFQIASRTEGFEIWGAAMLLQNKKVVQEDWQTVAVLERAVMEPRLAEAERTIAEYALGKAFEELGDPQSAMRHYDEANRVARHLRVGDAPFDHSAYRAAVDEMLASVPPSPAYLESSELPSSDLPIVILGMMRSGTTLVEQILSSHPDVGAAGEQMFWAENWGRVRSQGLAAIPRLGQEYLDRLSGLAPGKKRVTDKLPGNYKHAGLIHLAVPNAKIIHLRRSPLDTALSIWATPNNHPSEGWHRKRDLAFVYSEYTRIMEHWRARIPGASLLEIDYEELVSDREAVTRRMAGFCDLEWSDALLSPEENDRQVSTPSVWQVRQPVYRTSVERWRKFEPWLGELADLGSFQHPRANAPRERYEETAEDALAFGMFLRQGGNPDDAALALKRSLILSPSFLPAMIELSSSYADLGQVDKSIGVLHEAQTLARNSSEIQLLAGYRQQEAGDFQLAAKAFEKAIELDPDNAEAYGAFASIKTFTEEDRPFMRRLASLSARAQTPQARHGFNFALAKALADLGDYEMAMQHYDAAHASVMPSSLFVPAAHIALTDYVIRSFGDEFFAENTRYMSRSRKPLIIVGMPRSGTTLLEQVLSSHSRVGAGGECPFWSQFSESFARGVFESDMERMRIAADYLETLDRRSPGKDHVTDKMPLNFMALGMIHALFPEARIVHCMRDPADNCVSLYTTWFRGAPPPYVHSKEHLVLVYREYQRMMDHWRGLIPEDRLLELPYEGLVRDQENCTRKVVQFAGLEWDDACLRPEENRRTVLTPSLGQVRQPIHDSSIGRWKRYEPWLGGLGSLLRS
jgi:tetratricopeptide (TPR) repeat protein